MKYLIRCLHADFQKTKRLPIRKAHILIPIGIAIVFLTYYFFAPWNAYSKVEAYFQVLGIGFPFLIGLFSVILSEQEQIAGNFYEMLSASKRLPIFISKLLLLILLGTFSIMLASFIFGIGYFYILKQQVVAISFYGKAAFILLGSSIFLYTFHIFLALRLNKGVSIGVGIIESLVSALLLTGIGDSVWRYVPCAWSTRFVTYALASTSGLQVFRGEYKVAILFCAISTLSILILYGSWAYRWEGQNTSD